MEVQNAQKAVQHQSCPMESFPLATILFGVFCMENRGDHDASGMPRSTMERWQRKLNNTGLNTWVITGTVKG